MKSRRNSLIELPAPISRRRFIHTTALATAGVAVSNAIYLQRPARAQQPVKFGYVSPQTGPLAAFTQADDFMVGQFNEALADGIETAGGSEPVEVIVKDSQSNPNRAAEVANDLILRDEVDIVLVASTPETTNPVSDQCEINEIPCVSSMAPWQPWFFTRGGDPAVGFDWTYHFFWGLEDIIAVFLNMWNSVDTNKVVGGLYPNDGDGNAWGDPELGFPPALSAQGYSLVDPGRYQNLTDDFTAQITAFKDAGVEVVTGVVIPPDWTTFWTQAQQQGFRPTVASIGKAILFPVAVEALGDAGHNLSSEIWWTPSHPFSSSLTGASATDLAADYTSATGRQWTQQIGFVHALLEVAVDAMRRTSAREPQAVLDAIVNTNLDTIVGPINWSSGPVKNVAKTPLVGGQWRQGGEFAYELVITNNETAPNIPASDTMQPIA